MAQYDIYHIEERLAEWHPSFVRIDWDENNKWHKIIMRDARNREYLAMHVPAGQLDERVIRRMMEINPERGYNPFVEIDRELKKRERAEQSRIEDIAYGMAEVLRKPLINDAFY